jgi:hypothetical protein
LEVDASIDLDRHPFNTTTVQVSGGGSSSPQEYPFVVRVPQHIRVFLFPFVFVLNGLLLLGKDPFCSSNFKVYNKNLSFGLISSALCNPNAEDHRGARR